MSWELQDAVRTVRDLADLLRLPEAAAFSLDETATPELQRDALLMRLRYEHLAIPGVNWSLCDCLRASDSTQRATMFRVTALQLEAAGWTHDLLVALLAAGHDLKDARDAAVVLSSEL